MSDWWHLLFAWGLLILFFSVLWFRCSRIENYSYVDAWWALNLGSCAVFFAVMGSGSSAKSFILAVMVGSWAVRLGGHLLNRIRRHHPEEDARYQKLREVWSGRVRSAFFWFFQAQALSVLILAMPFFLVSRDSSGWGAWEWGGLALFLIGLGGESLADRQMGQFKKENSDSSAVCRKGLWRYSRHPNYFFEFVIWLAFYVFACGSDWGWLTFFAPGTILFLLLKVTGIPPTEASAVRRKGDAYRDYQRTTSAFVPLPPKALPPKE